MTRSATTQGAPDPRIDESIQAGKPPSSGRVAGGAADVVTVNRRELSDRWRLARLLLQDPISLLAALVLALMIIGAVGADLVSPYDPFEQDLRARNQAPTLRSAPGKPPHLLGTDQLGRDMLSRLLHGARVSLTVGLISVLLSGSIGTLVGLLAGYYRGWLDDLVMRLVDIQMGFPNMLLALTVLYVAGLKVVPGFIDLQINGAFGHDFTRSSVSVMEVAAQLPRYGVASFLPTIISAPLDSYPKLQSLSQAKQSGAEPGSAQRATMSRV